MVHLNLNGKTLIVAANEAGIYTSLGKDNVTGEPIFIGGFEVQFLDALKSHFNFSYKVVNCNSTWGSNINGSWTGVIGQVLYQKADLGIGALSFTYERSQVVHFLEIYSYSPLTYITSWPGLKPPVKLIIEPFDTLVWIFIMFVLLLVILVQRIIVCKIINNKKSDITWPLISCLLKQEKPKNFPSASPIRLIYLFWSFACLIIINFYSGRLYSIMTFPIHNPAINSVEKLAHEQSMGKIQALIPYEDSTIYTIFKTVSNGINYEVGKHMLSYNDINLAIEMVLKAEKPHALISTRNHLLSIMMKNPPKSFYIPPPTEDATFYLDRMSMVMKKDFAYTNKFDIFTSRMIRCGIFDYWERRESKKTKAINNKKQNGNNNDNDNGIDQLNKPLTMGQLQSIFYLFAFGIAISTLLIIIEMIFWHKNYS